MNKRLKIIALALASLGILLVLILVLAASLIDLSQYREVVATKIQETLHRKVYVGQIQHTLWTGLGAEINGITILDKDEARAFIEAERVSARVRLLPLLSKKIEVSTLVLKNPKIFLERDESGVWNFEDILPVTPTTAIHIGEGGNLGARQGGRAASTFPSPLLSIAEAAAQTDTAESEQLGYFFIDTFKIIHGMVTVQDRKVNKETTFLDINLEAEDIAPGAHTRFQLSTELNGEIGADTKATPTKVEASGTLGPLPQHGGWKGMGFNVKAKLEELILSHFAPYYKKQLGVELLEGELGGEVELTGQVGTYLNSEGKFEVTDFLWKDPELFTSPLRGINASVNGNLLINFLEDGFKLVNSSLITQALAMDVTGEIQRVKSDPQLNLTIKLENLAWDKLFALLPPETLPNLDKLKLGGVASIVLQPQGSLKDLNLMGTINLDQSYVQYENLFLKPQGVPGRVALEGHIGENALTLSNLTMNLNDVQIGAVGTIQDLKTGEPSLDLKVTSPSFLPGKLLELFPSIGPGQAPNTSGPQKDTEPLKVSGPGNLAVIVKGKPKDLRVEGSVNFDQSEVIYGTKIHKGPKVPANLEFSSQRKGDELDLEKLTLQLSTLVVNATGSVKDFTSPSVQFDLATNKFNLDELQQQLTPTATPLLPGDVVLTGPTELKLHAEGPADKLQVRTNLDLTDNGIKYKDIFSKPAKVKSEVKVEAAWASGQLNIDQVVFSLEDLVVKAAGTIGSLSSPDLNLQVDTNTFDLNTLLGAVPLASRALPELLTLAGKTNLSVRSKGKPEDLSLAGNLNLNQGLIQYGEIFKKPAGVPGSVTFNTEVKKDAVNISNTVAQLGNLALQVNGSISNFQNPKLNLDLSTNSFDTGEFQTNLLPGLPLTDLTLTGASELQAHVEGPPQALDIQSTFNLTKNHIRYRDFFVKPEGVKSNLELNTGLRRGDVMIKNLVFLLEDLELRAKGTIVGTDRGAPSQRGPLLNLEVVTNEFDVQKLLQKSPVARTSLPPDLKMTGPGKLTLKTEGPVSDLHLAGLINLDKGEVSYGNMFKKASGIPGRLEFDLLLKKERFEIQALKLNINDVVLDIKGFITSSDTPQTGGRKQKAEGGERQFDLRLQSHALALNQLAPLLGPKGHTGQADLNLNLKGSWKDITTGEGITGTVNFKNVQLALPELRKPIENLTASAVLTGGEVNVKGLTASLGNSVLTGNLRIKDLPAPKVQFDLHAPRLNLDELMEMKGTEKKAAWEVDKKAERLKAEDRRGEVDSLASILDLQSSIFMASTMADRAPEPLQIAETPKSRKRPPKKAPEEVPALKGKEEKPSEPEIRPIPPSTTPSSKVPETQAEAQATSPLWNRAQAWGTLRVDQGTVKNLDFARLTTQVQMANKVIQLEDLVFNFYDGTHQGSATIDLNPPQPVYRVNTQLSQVSADKLFAEKTQLGHMIYGLLFANVKLEGQGFDLDRASKTLTGSGELEILKGKLTAFSIFHEIAPLFELMGQAGKVKELLNLAEQFKAAPEDTEFSLFKGHFNIQNGQAGTGDLIIEVRDPRQNLKMVIEITGTLGLDNTALDLTGKLSFFNDFKYYPELVKYFPERNGRVTIPFPIPIQGTLLQPEFNLASVETSISKFAAEMALQKGIQSGLDKLLKKKEDQIPGQSTSPPPSTETPAEGEPSVQKKSRDVVEDISKGILDQIFKKKK